jgi:hypothetical protein
MKNFILSPGLLISIPFIIFFISLLASIKSKNYHWFQRSGAIVVIFGTLLLLRATLLTPLRERALDRLNYAKWGAREELEKQEKQIWKEEIIWENFGLVMIIMGSAIWAYGDLIGKKKNL